MLELRCFCSLDGVAQSDKPGESDRLSVVVRHQAEDAIGKFDSPPVCARLKDREPDTVLQWFCEDRSKALAEVFFDRDGLMNP